MDSSSIFMRNKHIRFHHCDPAGIVFYPQYFVLFHEFIEDWFNEGLGIRYAEMIQKQRLGIPTVRLECDFLMPSRLGDVVTFKLEVTKIGKSSICLELNALGDDNAGNKVVRVTVRQTVVLMSLETGRSCELPEAYRSRMASFTTLDTSGVAIMDLAGSADTPAIF